MQEGEIVLGLLFPANKEPTEAIDPSVGSFDDPTTSTIARLGLQVVRFLAATFDVGCVVSSSKESAYVVRVVAFVET